MQDPGRRPGEQCSPSCPVCGGAASPVRPTSYPGRPRWFGCAGCTTEFLFPQPGDARLGEIYGPSYYEAWGWERPEVVQAMKERTFMRALSMAPSRPGSRLLDVGCAQGELAAAAVRGGYEVAGVDVNEAAIARAREQVPAATFHCGPLDPDVVGTGWDVVTMFDFIEHVRDPVNTVARAASVLRPGGVVVISTPRVGSLVHRATGGLWPQYREEHLVLFSDGGLRQVLEKAGFSVDSLVPTTKYSTGAYLFGQTAEYAPDRAKRLAERARPILRLGVMHRPLPLRFGEMTVVARLAP